MVQRNCVLPLVAIVLSACAYTGSADGEIHYDVAVVDAAASTQDPDAPQGFQPLIPSDDDADWIKLVSGEWLRGEFETMRDGTVEFESDELDSLVLDWDDIPEVRLPQKRAILLEDGQTVIGAVLVRGDAVLIDGDASRRLDRARVLAIVPEAANGRSHWSGTLSLGITQRSGNTDQTDSSSYAFVRRETPATRWDTSYNGAYSRVENTETANSHRMQTRFDWFLSRRLFVTPIGATAFRDPFQNIAVRITPFAAVGYDVIDSGDVDWSVSVGPAYQYTRYETVGVGEDESEDTAAAVFQSRFGWDITPDIEFDLDYDITVPLPDSGEFNHHLAAMLSVDLTGDFDLDLSVIWDRVNEPIPDFDGNIPDEDDFRVVVGIGYDF